MDLLYLSSKTIFHKFYRSSNFPMCFYIDDAAGVVVILVIQKNHDFAVFVIFILAISHSQLLLIQIRIHRSIIFPIIKHLIALIVI